jgi:hypothetical protein
MKESYKFRPDAFQLFDISKCSRIPDERDMLNFRVNRVKYHMNRDREEKELLYCEQDVDSTL